MKFVFRLSNKYVLSLFCLVFIVAVFSTTVGDVSVVRADNCIYSTTQTQYATVCSTNSCFFWTKNKEHFHHRAVTDCFDENWNFTGQSAGSWINDGSSCNDC